jgi:hypothetical protein
LYAETIFQRKGQDVSKEKIETLMPITLLLDTSDEYFKGMLAEICWSFTTHGMDALVSYEHHLDVTKAVDTTSNDGLIH